MNMDRTSFLALAALIAAGACVTKKIDTSHEDMTPTGTTTGNGGTGGVGGAVGGAGGAGGSVCDDSIGDPGDCAPAAETVCGAFAEESCEGAKSYYKPRIAELAVTCITSLETSADCDAVYQCKYDALAQACADPTADDLCAEIVDACELADYPTTLDECHSLVDGLNATGRLLMQEQCGTGGCLYGITSCTEGM